MIQPPVSLRFLPFPILPVFIAAMLSVCVTAPAQTTAAPLAKTDKPSRYYLPGPQAARILTVSKEANAAAEVTLMTEAVVVKETGSKVAIDHFGEVYAYSPS